MPKFVPQFWEILLDNNELDKLPYKCLFSYQSREYPKNRERKQILNLVIEIIESELTQRQRECIKLSAYLWYLPRWKTNRRCDKKD